MAFRKIFTPTSLKINGIKLKLTAYQMGIRSAVIGVKIIFRVGEGSLRMTLPDDRLARQVPEYKDNAQECRELAKRMPRPEDRDALERITQIWERLENVRERRR
jgi:hypothetical protein